MMSYFQTMCREPPPNCLCISMAQVKEADRQLFHAYLRAHQGCRVLEARRVNAF